MKKTILFTTLLILFLVASCGKEEVIEPQPVNSNNLVFTSKPLSVDSELVKKEAAFGKRAFHTSVVHNKQIWVIAGQVVGSNTVNGDTPNDVWATENGTSWKLVQPSAAFNPRADHATTVHNGFMWLVAGRHGKLTINDTLYNDVWYSKNGKDWLSATKKANFTPRSSHTLSTFKGRMWLIGGQNTFQGNELNKDVWVSGDGKNWSLATANAPFGEVANHTTVVHDNKLWVIGGYGEDQKSSNYNFRNDVWYTIDGFTWTQATPQADFSPRSGHTAISYDNYLWVIGGKVGQGKYSNDIWRSSDGVDWVKVKKANDFGSRSDHTSVVFNKQFWAIAGQPLISYPTKNGVFTQGNYSDIWAFN